MFEKFDRKVARGCLVVFVGVTVFCAVAGFNLWHYVFIDEPMVSAAMDCDYDEVEHYLDAGARPNTRFDGMQSALKAARECKDTRITSLLKARGATE